MFMAIVFFFLLLFSWLFFQACRFIRSTHALHTFDLQWTNRLFIIPLFRKLFRYSIHAY